MRVFVVLGFRVYSHSWTSEPGALVPTFTGTRLPKYNNTILILNKEIQKYLLSNRLNRSQQLETGGFCFQMLVSYIYLY